MKVLIFEIWHVSPQFETGLELAEIYAENGEQVQYVNIGGSLPYIEWYDRISQGFAKNVYQKSVHWKIKQAQKLISSKIQVATDILLTEEETSGLKEHLVFSDIEELKKYHWDGMDLGMAAASSHISVTNDLTPDTKRDAEIINDIILASKMVAVSFRKWLEKAKPDLVIFRNGRVSSYRPVLRICQQIGQKFLVHDRGCDKDHYTLGATYRHDWEMRKRELEDHWVNSDLTTEEKKKIGRSFFEDRKSRKNDAHIVFAKNQQRGLLPLSWSQKNYNVVFFNSSIAEYAAVGDEVNPHVLFDSQEDSIKEIGEILSKRIDTKFYLRLHPNLINQSQNELDIWYNFPEEQIEIIPPEAKIDTYTLVEKADLVICYLSTVGVEAAYCGTPTIILARSLYERLDVTYRPQTKNELRQLLLADTLEPKSAERTLEYGYYMKTHGTKYKYYKALDHRNGLYKGVNLQQKDFKYNKRKITRPFKGIYRLLKRNFHSIW